MSVARIQLDLADEDLRTLRGALLAARASELGEQQRRGNRLSFGYGSDSARDGMSAEVRQLARRLELLDQLLAAVNVAIESEREIRT